MVVYSDVLVHGQGNRTETPGSDISRAYSGRPGVDKKRKRVSGREDSISGPKGQRVRICNVCLEGEEDKGGNDSMKKARNREVIPEKKHNALEFGWGTVGGGAGSSSKTGEILLNPTVPGGGYRAGQKKTEKKRGGLLPFDSHNGVRRLTI